MQWMERVQEHFLLKAAKRLVALEAIEVRHTESTVLYFNALLFAKNKNDISVSEIINYSSIEDLEKWIAANATDTVAILNINSDRIIHRILDIKESEEADAGDLSGIPSENAYIQNLRLSKGKTIKSVIRKQSVEDILSALAFMSDVIVAVTVGPFFTLPFIQHANTEGDSEFTFENYKFIFRRGELTDFVIDPYSADMLGTTLKVGEQNISSQLYAAYGLGLAFYSDPLSIPRLQVPQISHQYEEFNLRHVTTRLFLFTLVGTFIVLLCCTILYGRYEGRYTSANDRNAILKQSLYTTNQNLRRISRERQRYLENGLCDSSFISYYADQLAFALPPSMYLRKITVHPHIKSGNEENGRFDFSKIIVEGNCLSGGDLNQWVAELKTYPWIKNVMITRYADVNVEMAEFIIEISKGGR